MGFQLGMAVFGGLALLVWGPWSFELPEIELPELSSWVESVGEPSVTIMLMESRESLDAMRKGVDAERIVARSPEAFALIEGRIFATSIDAANGPLNAAGWAGRSLEFIDPAGLRKPRLAGIGDMGSDPSQGDGLADLMAQPTLSHSDSMRLLKEMERRGDL